MAQIASAETGVIVFVFLANLSAGVSTEVQGESQMTTSTSGGCTQATAADRIALQASGRRQIEAEVARITSRLVVAGDAGKGARGDLAGGVDVISFERRVVSLEALSDIIYHWIEVVVQNVARPAGSAFVWVV